MHNSPNSSGYKRIYTCTPVSFHANDGFFTRDSGLFCKTLLSMGIESKSIMPLPYYEDDQNEHLIRTSMSNLKSPAWWSSLNLDGVILYSWGQPQYTAIAKAIKKAGIRLSIHMDTSGSFDRVYPEEHTWWRAAAQFVKSSYLNIFRSRHLAYADVITIGLPAARAISKMRFMNDSVVRKHFPCPCPVHPSLQYNEHIAKEDIILGIGRWNDVGQKRPGFLIEALNQYYKNGGSAKVRILGKLHYSIEAWHADLPEEIQSKIELIGPVPNEKLRKIYQTAKIILCTSRNESSHIVSGEGLCSGCSVVVTNRPEFLKVVAWYTTKNSGTISQEDTPESFADAIKEELDKWEQGLRKPKEIASAWYPYFHADKVIEKIFPDFAAQTHMK